MHSYQQQATANFLQPSILCSQFANKNHKNALLPAEKALFLLKNICE